MPTTQHLGQSRVDWDRITRDDFDRLVEILLLKHHNKPPFKVDVVRGAGGDTGIDVVVWLNGKAVKIYQLKYFPEGWTGGHRKSRHPQVVKSFNSAWTNHQPIDWILVMPPNPHITEIRDVETLAQGKGVQVEIWGKQKLSELLLSFPDLERAFTQNAIVELLIEMIIAKGSDTDRSNVVLQVSRVEGSNNLLVENTGGVDAEDVVVSVSVDDDEYGPSLTRSGKPMRISANGSREYDLNWTGSSTGNLLVTFEWTQTGVRLQKDQNVSISGVSHMRSSKSRT